MFNSTLTMFCPTREAFTKFNNEDFNRLLEPVWVRHATEFLLNHLTMPAQTRAELVAKAPDMITMLNGAQYELKRSGDLPRIKNSKDEQARSEFGDIIALDGYVACQRNLVCTVWLTRVLTLVIHFCLPFCRYLHLIDTAITPTAVSRSVYDQSNLNPDFSLLTENIDFVQMTDMIDRDLPITLLAPNNQAFRRITFGTLDGANIIKKHLFSGLLFCDVIANSTEITSVNSDVLKVELRGKPKSGLWGTQGQNLFVGGAYLYQCDIFARNGVLHYVDRVIGESYDTVSPTVSPAPTITPQPTAFVPPTAAPVEGQSPVAKDGIVPIVLPPILPGVVPSAQTADAPSPAPVAASMASRTSGYGLTIFATLGISWMLRVLLV
jgi:uncharacterized surface protein with fasciclin (FAS1) repeats